MAAEEGATAVIGSRDEGGPVRPLPTGGAELASALRRVEAALRDSDRRFRAMADSAPGLVWASDAAGACTWFNAAWLRFTGRRLEDELGDGWTAGVHPDDLPRCLRTYRDALAARRPFEMEYRLRRHDGEHRWVLDRGSPLLDGDGLAGFVGMCVDIHERRVEAERQRFLADASAALDSELGVDDRLGALVALLARRVGDACLVEMAGPGGELQIVAASARDPADEARLRAFRARHVLPESDPHGVRRVVATGRTLHTPEVSDAMVEDYLGRVGADGPLADATRARPPRSVVVAPLRARGRTLGAVLVMSHGDSRLGAAELELVEEVGRRAGLAVDNALLHDRAEGTAQRLRALQEATAALSSAATPADVGEVAARHARELLGARSVTIFELRGDELRALALEGLRAADLGPWERVALADAAPVADAARLGAPVWMQGLGDWRERYPHLVGAAGDRGIGAAVALPLVAGGETVGAVAISFLGDRRFDDADRDTARLFGEACGQSLARARLQRRDEVDRRRAELVAEVGFALDAASGVDTRLERLVRLLVPRVADLATVRLTGIAGGPSALAAVAAADDERERIARDLYSRYTAPPARPGPERVIVTGEAELIPEATDDIRRTYAPDAAFAEGMRRLDVASYLSVPLRARGAVLGALTLMTTGRSGRRFGPHDLATAHEVAARAGLAIDNARRYEGEQAARAAAERMRGRTDRLQRVTAGLSAALTEQQVARVVVDEVMDALGAVAGAVVVREGDRARVVVATGYPDDVLRAGADLPLDAPSPLAAVLRGGPALWFESADDWAPDFPPPRADLGAAGVGLPLRSGGRLVGALALRFGAAARKLSAGERRLALAMAGQCAQALERAALYDAERHEARVLQRALLPAAIAQPAAARLGVRYLPAAGGRSGGDFYDAVERPDGALGVVVGDVVGHGVEAAAVMGQLRSAWRAISLDFSSPSSLTERLSRYAEGVEGAAVATVACACLYEGVLRYTCAGHPPPLLRRADGSTEYLMDGRGAPLAVGGPAYGEGRVRLAEGDVVLLYTDGVVERERDMQAGMERLAALVAAAPGDAGAILDLLAADIGVAPADDCALLALAIVRAPAPLALSLPARADVLGGARADVRRWLADAGLAPAEGEDVVLAISEALANAVEHGYGGDDDGRIHLHLSAAAGPRLDAVVSDGGRWRPPDPDPGIRGRGLMLMRAVMDEVAVEPGPSGTTVRMRRGLGRATAPAPPAPPPGPAALSRRPIAGGVLVHLGGEIDAAVATEVGERLAALVAGEPGRVVLDMSDVAHLGSAGVRMVVQLAGDADRRGARAEVIAPPGGAARRALELSGVADELTVLDG